VVSPTFTYRLVLLAALVFTAGLMAVASQGRLGGISRGGAGNVPIIVAGGQGTNIGVRPLVDVRVANGPPIPVLLDTGSTGLAVYAWALDRDAKRAVAVSSHHVTQRYADGEIQTGVMASGPITVGGITTTRRVSFLLIQRVGCDALHPNCPRHGLAEGAVVDGLLGTSLTPASDGAENPLLVLPAPYSRAWSIHLQGNAGTLTLGARLPEHPSVEIRLPRLPSTSRWPNRFDDGDIPICWSFQLVKLCLPTVFDTGSNAMAWLSPAWVQPPWNTRPYLPQGWRISASLPGATRPFWIFAAGHVSSENIITRTPAPTETVNTGVQAFYAWTITYDPRLGRLLLTPQG
jgi:Aspartyl protease